MSDEDKYWELFSISYLDAYVPLFGWKSERGNDLNDLKDSVYMAADEMAGDGDDVNTIIAVERLGSNVHGPRQHVQFDIFVKTSVDVRLHR